MKSSPQHGKRRCEINLTAPLLHERIIGPMAMICQDLFCNFFSSLAFGKTSDQITQFCMFHAEMMQIAGKPGGAARCRRTLSIHGKNSFALDGNRFLPYNAEYSEQRRLLRSFCAHLQRAE